MISPEQRDCLFEVVKQASLQWQMAFNSGDAAGCVKQYEQDAVMHARPIGTFSGTSAIHSFWQQLMDQGYSTVCYIDPIMTVVDEKTVQLSAQWTMNKARGVIHKELWVIQADGSAKLREDDFEVQG